MTLSVIPYVGFCWVNSAAAATATATATATGAGSSVTLTAVGTDSQGSTGSTKTFTVPAGGIPAGSTIVMAVANSSARTIASASDTKGNTYSVGLQKTDGTRYVSLVYAQNITALVAGDIITATYSGTAASRCQVVAYATGLTTGTLIDKNASATGTSTSPSSGATAVTTVATEAVIGFVSQSSTTGSITEPSGYTSLGTVTASSGSAIKLDMAYKVVTSTGAQTYAPTLASSLTWACGVETLKT